MTDRVPYEVGYGKPPRKNQFPPGKSGNPGGRLPNARGLKAELRAELDEFVTIAVDGQDKRVRKLRLVIKALVAKAAKGNVSAADKVLSHFIQAFGFEDERPTAKPLSATDRLLLEQFLLGDGEKPSGENADEQGESDESLAGGAPDV